MFFAQTSFKCTFYHFYKFSAHSSVQVLSIPGWLLFFCFTVIFYSFVFFFCLFYSLYNDAFLPLFFFIFLLREQYFLCRLFFCNIYFLLDYDGFFGKIGYKVPGFGLMLINKTFLQLTILHDILIFKIEQIMFNDYIIY